jgi:hypothetical protein
LNGGEFDDAAFPAPVQAEALQVVEQIVAPRDGGEKVVDLRGALFARCVENTAHAVSLAHWQAQKVKAHKIALRQQKCLIIWHQVSRSVWWVGIKLAVRKIRIVAQP